MMLTAASIFERLPRFFRRHKLMQAWMRLTGEDPLQLVRIRDDTFGYVDLDEGFMRLVVIDQDYEQEFFQIADAFLQQEGTFLDVGANFGLFSFGLAGTLQDRVDFHLFEPNLKVVAAIRRTLAHYPDMRCHVNAVAISDHIGTVSFKVVPDHTGISCVVEGEGEPVPVITLDAYCDEANIDRIALLKLDVEGHELPRCEARVVSSKAQRLRQSILSTARRISAYPPSA